MSDLAYDAGAIHASSNGWLEQSVAVQSAAQHVQSASVAGFDDESVSAVRAFLDTWRDVTKDIAARASDTSDHLKKANDSIIGYEETVREEFLDWLGETP